MKKYLIRGMVLFGLLGSAIGVNAQDVRSSAKDGYRYNVIQDASQQDIKAINNLVVEQEAPQLLANEATFKLNITIPYLGENGYIDFVNVSRYDNEEDWGEHYWEGWELDKDFPVDNYYVQVIARDDDNYYSLFAKTNNGVITFTESDLVSTTIHNNSGLGIRDALVLPIDDMKLEWVYHVQFDDMEDKPSIKLISNKNLVSDVGLSLVSDTGFTYRFRSERNMASDQQMKFGHLCTSYYNNTNQEYMPDEYVQLSLYDQILILDEYGNRLTYLAGSSDYEPVCDIILSKAGYTDTQEVEVNGDIAFYAPNEEGTYDFKLQFNQSLPIAIPSVKGQLQVGNNEESSNCQEFVANLYRYCMDREPDEAGLNSWVQRLKNKEMTAADTLKFFLNSQEFSNKLTSNQTYIDILYKVCMGRSGDVGGIEYWNSILKTGDSRNNILVNFVNSKEFTDICNSYGVVRGALELEIVDVKTEQIKAFVTGFYNNCLGRAPEKEGLEYWIQGLKDGYLTGAELGRSFVTSQEMEDKNLNVGDYIEVLYDTFMGRSADEAGKTYWIQCIQSGMTREQVMMAFIWSPEFSLICQEYGIKVN